MYRLGSADELFDIGWEDYLARGGVCAVEWSENVEDALEENTIRVDIRSGRYRPAAMHLDPGRTDPWKTKKKRV